MKRAASCFSTVAAVVPSIAQQAPGQIRPRPAEGRRAGVQPPTIREYKPKSQLVAPQHPVPRAKYPVIDIHSHQPTPISPAEYDRVMKGMEANNLQILVNLSGSFGDRLRQRRRRAAARASYRTGWSCSRTSTSEAVGPGFGARRPSSSTTTSKAGAVGLKIFKDLGMFVSKAERRAACRSTIPELDPIWETCARHNVPGAHSRRRAAGVLRAARLHERALARARAVSRIAGISRACASSS